VQLAEQKQAFSKAYARAVAAVAGFKVDEPETDDDSIDMRFSAGATLPRRPQIEAQLKCSADDELRIEDFSFWLSKKNYDDLRATTLVPRILVVVRVPLEPAQWLDLSEQELVLSYCGYWHSLSGAPEITNETGMTLRIRREHVFTPGQLQAMMAVVETGDRP
jgi:hypothetical protein